MSTPKRGRDLTPAEEAFGDPRNDFRLPDARLASEDARGRFSDPWTCCPKCYAGDETHVYAELDGKDVWNLCLACGYAELWAAGSLIAERQVFTCPRIGGKPK
jgi:hypothetical protein